MTRSIQYERLLRAFWNEICAKFLDESVFPADTQYRDETVCQDYSVLVARIATKLTIGASNEFFHTEFKKTSNHHVAHGIDDCCLQNMLR